MKRYVVIAMLILVAALATVANAAGDGAQAASPYGEWKAKMTKNQLIDYGMVDPRFVGTWKLVLSRNGTYRLFNPLDRWGNATFKVSGQRLIFQNDKWYCSHAPPSGQTFGVYRWSIKQGKLKLTVVGADVCGGRWQTLATPLWTRA